MHADLNTEACARLWHTANDQRDGTYCACVNCPIGARHAGEKFHPSQFYQSNLCARCNRPSSRLIHDLHCPSCYNRQREWIIGHNAKGTPLTKLKNLAQRSVLVRVDGSAKLVTHRHTIDELEAFVATLRTIPGAVLMAFHSKPLLKRPRQLSLFGEAAFV